MKLKVFDVEVKKWDKTEADYLIDVIEQLDITISKYEEIHIHRNEISVALYGNENYYSSGKPELMVYYFELKYESLDNGTGMDAPVEIDWDEIRSFYNKYAEIQSQFIDAIDNGDLETAKQLNKDFPRQAKPSLADSFFARWLIKTGNIEFLKWAKSVDKNIDFSEKSRHENPLKIAIGYNYEDMAIWLIDNYPVSLFDKHIAFGLIDVAYSTGMTKLVSRMLQEKSMMDQLIKANVTKYFDEQVKDIFLF